MPTLSQPEDIHWADASPGTTRSEPLDSKQDTGYIAGEVVPALALNWILGVLSDRVAFDNARIAARLPRGYVVSGMDPGQAGTAILRADRIAVQSGTIEHAGNTITHTLSTTPPAPAGAGSAVGVDAYLLVVQADGSFNWSTIGTGLLSRAAAVSAYLASPSTTETPICILLNVAGDSEYLDEHIVDLRGGVGRPIGRGNIQAGTQPQDVLQRPRLYVDLTNQNNSDPQDVKLTLEFLTGSTGQAYPRHLWGSLDELPIRIDVELAGVGTESTAAFGSWDDGGALTARIEPASAIVGDTAEIAVQVTENGTHVNDGQGNPGGYMHWSGSIRIAGDPGDLSTFRLRLHRQAGKPAQDYLVKITTGLGSQAPIRVTLPST